MNIKFIRFFIRFCAASITNELLQDMCYKVQKIVFEKEEVKFCKGVT